MNLSDSIGGYFGLEMQIAENYYSDLIAVNTGRNALEYILKARGCKHIYIPYYTCDVILEPIQRLHISYEFYKIDEQLELQTLNGINQDSFFLLNNYFGLKTKYVEGMARMLPNVIVDSSQAFFDRPIKGVDTFYSPRKFFGLPDGGYVSCDLILNENLENDYSGDRIAHLIGRIDRSAEESYVDFKMDEFVLRNQSIKKISKFTNALLKSIDYQNCLRKRNENFSYLHSRLKDKNDFKWFDDISLNGPMAYPFYSEDKMLRKKLTAHKIYVPIYWPNVFEWADNNGIEYQLCENLFALPIDQRYGPAEMETIINIILG